MNMIILFVYSKHSSLAITFMSAAYHKCKIWLLSFEFANKIVIFAALKQWLL